jgi:hypothetical protein
MVFQTSDLDRIHSLFLEHMGLTDTWGTLFEFTAYLGFWPVNCIDARVRNGGAIEVPHKYQYRIEQLTGPHAYAMMAAYKCRRYSAYGRVKTFLTKCWQVPAFVFAVIVGLVLDILT